jgi:hypothetical protein
MAQNTSFRYFYCFKGNYRPLFYLVLLLLPSACLTREEYNAEDVQALIDKEVEERVNAYTRIKQDGCRDELLKEANRLADSILIAEAFFERDTTQRPLKPEKPEKPAFKISKDTTPIKPLFDRKKLLEGDKNTTQETENRR